jgi:GT2 family glycosyltransferase
MPVRNEEAAVKETMEAIFASTRLPDEIVIGDGRSTDATVAKICEYSGRGLPLRVIDNSALYSGGGRNRAIESSSCDVILLADFGNRIDSRWIEQMLRPFEESDEVDAVAGMFRPWVRTDMEHCMAAIHYFDDYTLASYSESEKEALLPMIIAPGALSFAVSRRIWEAAGGFPEWLLKGQDKLFSRKIRALGATVAVSWDATIYHHIRGSSWQIFRQLYAYGRGNGQMRYVNLHFFKLSGFYGLLTVLTALFPFGAAFPLSAGALFFAYVYHSGIRKIAAVENVPMKFRYVLLCPLVLVPRDLGTIAGHVVGWLEWLFVPRYRREFRKYTKNCSPDAFEIIAR